MRLRSHTINDEVTPIKEKSEEIIEVESLPGRSAPGSVQKQNQRIFDNFMMVRTPCNDGDNFSSGVYPSSGHHTSSAVISPEKDLQTIQNNIRNFTPYPSMFTPKPPIDDKVENSITSA